MDFTTYPLHSFEFQHQPPLTEANLNHQAHNSQNSLNTQAQNDPMSEDLYDRILAQVPDEQIMAGLHQQSQSLHGAQVHGSGRESLSSQDDSITLENLLEDDPLLSFTTTLDRQRSNDTIIELSSPISNSSDDLVPDHQGLQGLGLCSNNSTASIVQQAALNRNPLPEQQNHTATNTPRNNSFVFVHANKSVPNISRPNYTVAQPHAGPGMPIYPPQFQQAPGVTNGALKGPMPLAPDCSAHQIQANEFRMRIQNQVMFQQQQQRTYQHHQSQVQQQHVQIPVPPHLQGHPSSQPITPVTPQFAHHQSQQSQSPHLSHMTHSPQMHGQHVPHMQQVPVHLQRRQQPTYQAQHVFQMQDNEMAQPMQMSPVIQQQELPIRTPSKPPMIKSSSTTKLSKAKKGSFSGGTPKSAKPLMKSKSFLNTASVTKKSAMYQTLDFSKNVMMTSQDGSKRTTPLKIGVMKSFEFVYEPGDGKVSSPRRPSASSTPIANKFAFAKPPPIDANSFSNYSPSPTASEASGHSPLTFTGNFPQPSPAAVNVSKFGNERTSPLGTGAQFMVTPPKNKFPAATDKPFVLKDTKSGMVELNLE